MITRWHWHLHELVPFFSVYASSRLIQIRNLIEIHKKQRSFVPYKICFFPLLYLRKLLIFWCRVQDAVLLRFDYLSQNNSTNSPKPLAL